MNYLLERLNEASTWRGLAALTTAFGVALNPDQMNAIVAAGLGVIGLINVFRAEKKV